MVNDARTRRGFLKLSGTVAGTVGGLVVGGSLLGACTSTSSGNALANARESGSIKIGIANEAPYGFTDDSGRVTGEAPEVARAVLSAIGINDVRPTTVDFNALIPALNARQFDMVCAGMNITPTRCAQAVFSIPDYSALTAFLVPVGNPQQVRTFEDLVAKNLTVAVLSAAVEQGYAEESGVPGGNIQVFGDQNALLQAVTAGRTYCASLTDISLKWLVKENKDVPVEVTPGFDPMLNGQPVVSAGGFVFRTADSDLRQAFNDELRTLHTNGRWVEIASKFGFSDVNLPGELTTEQLCSAS